MIISEELLERYILGNASFSEIIQVELAAKKDEELERRLIEAKSFEALQKVRERESLPAERMAAKSEGNRCVIECERFILRQKVSGYEENRNIFSTAKEEIAFSEDNDETSWLKNKGTLIVHIGNILKLYGLVPTKHSICELSDLVKALERKDGIIAVVNEGLLSGKEGENKPDHAVCVLALEGDSVVLFNPSTGRDRDSYPINVFLRAWEASERYAVFANTKGEKYYAPHPSRLFESIEIDADIEEIGEGIAEYTHDVWAERRFKQGYVYGPENNSDKKKGPLTNKDLVPYSELPESEKILDRESYQGAIKMLIHSGYHIEKISENDYKCPTCRGRIKMEWAYCPHCGAFLTTEAFMDKNQKSEDKKE